MLGFLCVLASFKRIINNKFQKNVLFWKFSRSFIFCKIYIEKKKKTKFEILRMFGTVLLKYTNGVKHQHTLNNIKMQPVRERGMAGRAGACVSQAKAGAAERNRTSDPVITKGSRTLSLFCIALFAVC